MDDEHSLVAQLAKLNACCHTLTDAIARLAYGSDYDGRYNGPGDRLWTEADARDLRERNENFPTHAKLPGASVFSGLRDEAALTAAITAWEADDRKKWAEAEATVQSALCEGEIKTFDEEGNATPSEFWLANKLRGRRGRARQGNFLLRVCDVSYLVHKKETNESKSFRGKMIARFINRQLRVRRWINFADIADYCAREPGSINPDPLLMASAFKQLGDALAKGEFETDGRMRVIYLDASVRWFKMTRELYEACPYNSRGNLELCWIPAELCRRWFETRRIAPPPWLPVTEASVAARSDIACATVAAVSDAASLHPFSNLAPPKPLDKLVRQWMRARVADWPEDKPAPSEKEDLKAVGLHFCGPLSRDEFRIVREEETPPEWRTQGRRKPWGLVKKSAV